MPNREGSVFDGSRFNVFDVFAPIPQWSYQNIGGIQPDPENPGFKHVIVKPQIGGNLSCAETSYNSINGEIRTHWWIEDPDSPDENILHFHVTIPINTTADIYIPGEDLSLILEGDDANEGLAHLAQGVTDWSEVEKNLYLFTVESGEYYFKSISERLFPFSCQFDCQECLDCEGYEGVKPCHICNPTCQE